MYRIFLAHWSQRRNAVIYDSNRQVASLDSQTERNNFFNENRMPGTSNEPLQLQGLALDMMSV